MSILDDCRIELTETLWFEPRRIKGVKFYYRGSWLRLLLPVEEGPKTAKLHFYTLILTEIEIFDEFILNRKLRTWSTKVYAWISMIIKS